MSPVHRHQDGFTLIEIVAVLVLLGILSAVAVPKFFDLQEEAETKAALSAAAEVQSRLDAAFSVKVLEGTSCTDAVTFASNLSNLSDNEGSQFGGFEIQKSGEETAPSLQYKKPGDSEWKTIANFTLVLPQCSSESSVSSSFSQAGLKVWEAMMSDQLDAINGLNDESDPYQFTLKHDGDHTYFAVRFQNKAAAQQQASENVIAERRFFVEIGKNQQSDKIIKVLVSAQYHDKTPIATGNDNLLNPNPDPDPKNEPERRDERIELFKTHCPNWESLFEIRTSESGNKYLVVK